MEVIVGCLRVLIKWFVCMWTVALSLAAAETKQARPGQDVYSENRDGYEVQRCGWEGGGR